MGAMNAGWGSDPGAATTQPLPTASIVLVEDDPALRELLVTHLGRQRIQATACACAEEMFECIARRRPDLLVLDVGLPGLDGLSACQRLRRAGERLPIILLTARSTEIDRVLGLESGADDYLCKPFSLRELTARIRAVLRRSPLYFALPGVPDAAFVGPWQFLPHERSLRRGREQRPLGPVESAVLIELLAHPGRALTREHLAGALRAERESGRAADAAVMRLRRIVETDPANPRLIRTVRGHGYMFCPDP